MASILSLMAQPIAPDIAGAFEQGRAQARQIERERLMDQELRAKLDRENRFRELAGRAYGAASPIEREQTISQAAAIDPQGAAQLGQSLGSFEDRRKERLGIMASALTNSPEQLRPLIYRSMVPELRQLGLQPPDEYTPEIDAVAQQLAAVLTGQGGTPAQRPPSNVQEWEYYSRLTPEQQQRYLQMKRATDRIVAIGGVPTIVQTGVQPTTQPLSTLEYESRAAGEKRRAQEEAAAEVEEEKTRRQNEQAFQAFQSSMQALEQAMSATQTGPIAGRLPAVTAAQQTAEGAVAAMAPILKQLFRSAGEGTFTDRDQELLLDMVPKRTDHPEARRAKIAMINQIVAAKLGMSMPGSQPPASAPETTTVELPPVNARGWRLMIDAHGNRAYVSPDGTQFEEVR